MTNQMVWVKRNVFVPVRDGVKLATDLYFPPVDHMPSGQSWPTLLLRTPYDKSAPSRAEQAARFANAGYVVMVQDCRGRFASEGMFTLGIGEAEDGYDTVEWAAEQAWCNGRVGTIGTSYMAWVQSALATLNPPHLAAMWVHEGIADGLRESVRQGGAFELRWMGWAFYGAATDPNAAQEVRDYLAHVDIRDWLSPYLPQPGQSPLMLTPNHEAWYYKYLTTATEGELWDSRGLNVRKYYEEHADVPSVYSGGWYDSYTRATIRNFQELSNKKQNPQFLVMGPWVHGAKEPGLTYAGDVDFGLDAAIDYFEIRRRWFDCWLKGEVGNPLPQVRIFLMGGGTGRKLASGKMHHGGRWIDSAQWPPKGVDKRSFYCHPNGLLVADQPVPHGMGQSVTYAYDPEKPVPTVGGNISFLKYIRPLPDDLTVPIIDRLDDISPVGGQNQVTDEGVFGATVPYGPLNQRPDVVSFVTEPLEEDVMLTGSIVVHLFVSSDAADTDFTVKLIDWYPPNDDYPLGYALNIADGIQRLRFANGYHREVLNTPDTVVPLSIETYPSANLFVKGHRIRLDISSSNFPRFDLNTNTGEPLGSARSTCVARNTIYMATDHPTRLEMEILPVQKSE